MDEKAGSGKPVGRSGRKVEEEDGGMGGSGGEVNRWVWVWINITFHKKFALCTVSFLFSHYKYIYNDQPNKLHILHTSKVSLKNVIFF